VQVAVSGVHPPFRVGPRRRGASSRLPPRWYATTGDQQVAGGLGDRPVPARRRVRNVGGQRKGAGFPVHGASLSVRRPAGFGFGRRAVAAILIGVAPVAREAVRTGRCRCGVRTNPHRADNRRRRRVGAGSRRRSASTPAGDDLSQRAVCTDVAGGHHAAGHPHAADTAGRAEPRPGQGRSARTAPSRPGRRRRLRPGQGRAAGRREYSSRPGRAVRRQPARCAARVADMHDRGPQRGCDSQEPASMVGHGCGHTSRGAW